MLTAPILYVGEDICRRIPVIERCGARVRRTSCSARELGEVLRNTVQYSAVTFHEDLDPIPAEVLRVARSYPSPLVLFENPSMNCDPACFDLMIPALTPPGLWLRSIQDSINYSRELRARSQVLRQENAALRAEVRARLSRMHQLLPVSVDLDEIWRIDSNTD